MRWLFFGLIVVHGMIHLLGFAKGFGIAELPQLTAPISRLAGTAWLAAALTLLGTATLLILAPRAWWTVGLPAVLVSQTVIVLSWRDAKLGTFVNVLLLAGVVYGFAAHGPFGLRAEYSREARRRLSPPPSPPLVTELDLAQLPDPVRRYVRATGSVGQPRVRDFRATWRGRIRATAADGWIPFTAEQHNFLVEPARFFLMNAVRSGLPVDVFHSFRDGSATMRVRLLSLFPLADGAGADFTRAETVTLLNDRCLFAPAALVDAPIRWDVLDERSVRARYAVGPNEIQAVLSFNRDGDLVDFSSEDRLAASADGKHFTRLPWSTPVGAYRSFGPRRAPTRGEGRWHAPGGEFAYLEIELLALEYNVR
jgi:hypothetical protein